MFTGIDEQTGSLLSIERGAESAILTIRANLVLEGAKVGDSIAVNGVCLTVTRLGQDRFSADVMAETLRRSGLGQLGIGDPVNLERAMAANGRFGGHIMSGHIDGTGRIASIRKEDNAVWYRIEASQKILKYIVEKGSITIDGISLTVAGLDDTGFSVSVIPHTRDVTTLSGRRIGDSVNLENDLIGKYVDRLLHFREAEEDKKEESSGGLTLDFLKEHGF